MTTGPRDWTYPPMDPAQAARLMLDVQRLGLESAQLVVERFSELFEQFRSSAGGPTAAGAGPAGAAGAWTAGAGAPTWPAGGPTAGADPGAAPGPAGTSRPNLPPGICLQPDSLATQRLQAAAVQAFDGYLNLLRRLGELTMPFLPPGRSGPGSAAPDALELPAVAPGGRSTARLWLHNSSGGPAYRLRVWSPGLFADTGDQIAGDRLSFSPAGLDRLDSEQSTEVYAALDPPTDARPGRYHGQLFVEHLPEVALAVGVRILALPGGPSP